MTDTIVDVPGVGIILMHEGKFLLQLRDDKPDIANPNVWGLIGGAIEERESPLEAARRECEEEIGISPEGLTYIGQTTDCKFRFYAHLSVEEMNRLILGEGQELRLFDQGDILRLKIAPRVRMFFERYGDAARTLSSKKPITAADIGLEE